MLQDCQPAAVIVLKRGMVCRGMSLDDFKFIYWMEYTHRMWGRVLGLVFAVPAAYFVYRGWVNGALGRRLGLLFAMGATQGFVGWWMVRSGLQVTILVQSFHMILNWVLSGPGARK